jgi:uncharacterized membrane protein
MLNMIKRFQAKEWFLITILMLLVTDLIIILNQPILRDIIPFLFFSIVPGFLVVTILRLNKFEFLIKYLLSVGLSISLLLAVGLFLNSLYPILLKPLSLVPVLVSLNILTVLLTVFAYQRNRSFGTSDIFNFKFKLGNKLLAPLIFPILFPLMAVIGTYLMNTTLNNILILTMLFLIPFYIIVVAYLRDRVHPYTYPVALFMIGMGLVLMHALTSAHIIGRDVHQEFYCFQLTLANFHWNIYDYYNPYNACLSITILPTIYQVLTNMNPEYVFKLLFGLLGSLLPLMVYTVAKKYLNNKYAFLASFLFVFQVFFIDIVGAVRQEVAVIFFFLAIMVLFDCFGETKFERSGVKKLLFLIFVASMVVTHYTTSYVAFVLLIPLILLPFLKNLYKEHRVTFVNFDVLLIYFLIVLIWFILYAKVQFLAGSDVIQSTVAATASATGPGGGNYAFETSREGTVLSILGIGIKNLANFIAVIANDLIFVTIGIGLLTLIWKYSKIFRNKTVYIYDEIKVLDSKIVLAGILSFILLALFIILPSVSLFYGSDRLFFQLLIFTVPLFIFGTLKIAEMLNKVIKKPDLKVPLILILLIFLFICNTHLQYEFTGIPFSPEYDKNGITRGELYIYDGELTTAKWIGTYRSDDINVYSDAVGFTRLFMSGVRTNVVGINFNNKTINGYLYLGNANVNEGKFYDTINSQQSVPRFSYFFNNKSRVFDDGYGQIWA